MTLETLKKVRLYYPGALGVILALVYYFGDKINSVSDLMQSGNSITLTSSIAIISIFLIGCLYNTIKLRNLIWGPIVRKTNVNIVSQLYSIAEIKLVKNLSAEQNKEVLDSVFYPIIDNDNTLSIKSNIVKENGVMTTCVIDTFILTLIFDLVWLCSSIIAVKKINLLVGVVFAVTILSILIIYLRYKNHINLSNDQLRVIRNNYKTKCKELLGPLQSSLNA